MTLACPMVITKTPELQLYHVRRGMERKKKTKTQSKIKNDSLWHIVGVVLLLCLFGHCSVCGGDGAAAERHRDYH